MTDRRRLLRLAAASATTLWLPRSAWSQGGLRGNPFTVGVASGSPTPDGVVLWTRLVQAGLFGGNALGILPITVRWEVAHDEAFSRIAARGQAQALPELAHSVHVEVAGLEPDRWYFYRFMAGDAVSPVGRTRTAPAPDAQPQRLRLAYASCQRWEHGHFAAWRHLVADQPDLVLFLGDYLYEYPGASQAVRPVSGGWVTDLAGYRARYALYKTDPALQAAHAACPWLVTWDDHEVQNDYAGGSPGDGGPPVADFAARRAAAYQAFYEHMPLRASALTRALAGLGQGAEMRVFGQFGWGRLAQLYLLDPRQYKDAQACTPPGKGASGALDPRTCPHWHDPVRSLLGPAQERWLEGRWAASARGATWNVVGQGSLFGRRDFRPGPDEFYWNDGWDGYPAARQRFTDALQRHRVPGAVILGGDVHENWVGHVLADYGRRAAQAVGVEFCGTSITSRSGGSDRLPAWLAENPHFVFADAQRKGYGMAEFTPAQLTTTLRVVDDVTRADAGIATLAAFRVPAGRPLLEAV